MILRISTIIVILVVLLGCIKAEPRYIAGKWNPEKRNYDLIVPKANKNGEIELRDAVAWASFDNAINQTGWGYLEVYTNASYDDTQQAYVAGLVEGNLTRDLIDMHWQNTGKGYCDRPFNQYCQKLQKYLNDNVAWMVQQITAKAETDPFWHHVELFLEQMSGIADGYLDTVRFPSQFDIDITTTALLQFQGDLEDLEAAFGKKTGRPLGSGSCSSLIKLLAGNKDLYVSQDTWDGYNSMLRILKKYDFKFRTTGKSMTPIPAEVMTFSSYPGTILSGDDFYIMSSGLVAIETTIGNSNPKLWSYISPTYSVLEEIRNVVANRLSHSGSEWVYTFENFNSGTYNNDWMIVDYKKFKPGHPLPDSDLLWVVETLPGWTTQQDVTQLFKNQTYWPSYNVAYFPDIFRNGGSEENVKKYGDWFSYENSPRAKIFRRDHSKVTDIESMTRLMRYNDFTHDPFSKCNCTPPYSAENAISARCDLNPASGKYPFGALGHRSHGGIDMKLTSSSMVPKQEFIAISSPAYDQVPAFQWSKSTVQSTPHIGHPDLWNFKPVQHKWNSRADY